MTFHKNHILVYGIILFIASVQVFSQTEREPFAEEKEGKIYYIQFTEDSPKIDGDLSEPVWDKIQPITDFVQDEPFNGEAPTEKTEVYLTYNDETLFIGARLYDSNPEGITRQLAPRDDWYSAFDEQADWFSIDLDSRHDHQTAFSFAVNASGVMSDEMVYNDADYDPDWNAIWHAEVEITAIGWEVEIEIPFSMLPFNEGDELTWGMNITRFIQRKFETITWVSFPLDVEGVASKYGHLTGLKGIYPPAKFEFQPYFMAGMTNYADIQLTDYEEPLSHQLNFKNSPAKNLGLNMLYRVNPNSILTMTLNPDFGQIESDPEDLNLTAFETYFPEKRPFFLKDADIFETPIEIFYSRRIGEKVYNAGVDTSYFDLPVLIKGAGKWTGKTESGLSYGLLGAATTLSDSNSWRYKMLQGENRYYFVGRVKQDLFEGNSYIGLMQTSSMVDSAHTWSVDGMSNLLDNQLELSGQFVYTSDSPKGFLGNMTFSPPGYLTSWLDFTHYDKALDLNKMGYLWRGDYQQVKFGLSYHNPEPWLAFRNSTIILEADAETNIDGLDLGKTIELTYALQLQDFTKLSGGYYTIFEHYDDRKIYFDFYANEFGPPVFIPEISGIHTMITSNEHEKFSGSFSFTYATNSRKDLERGQFVEATYKPNTYLTFSASYDRYYLEKQFHWLESFLEYNQTTTAYDDTHHVFSNLNRLQNVFTFRVSGNINRKISVQSFVEILSNSDAFDTTSYSEFTPVNFYDDSSAYIKGWGDYKDMPLYTSDETRLDNSYLDPNYYLGLYPKFTGVIFNTVLKWNYMKGSNLYIVVTTKKSVNGKKFSGLSGLKDFLLYNEERRWVEVLRDQSIMIKLDYWFDL
ncbi:MAG: DUF5916 domain-containing protein [Candidatus Marinimicrobia bacterium]|nr:DUF5916 domain-containing protein [Candidatus Neomarinimicrobiota bacterium]